LVSTFRFLMNFLILCSTKRYLYANLSIVSAVRGDDVKSLLQKTACPA
jgi:hypothetical protein